MTTYLCHSIMWSAFWFLAGFGARTLIDLRKKRLMPEKQQKTDRNQFLLGVGLALVGLLVVLSTVYNQHQRRDQRDEFMRESRAQRDCLTQQVVAITKSSTVRSNLNQQASDATKNAFLSVASAKTKADVRKALATYIATQAKVDAQRKAHPVPPMPSGSCKR